ncbi:MAG: Hpt domain-containing protein [Bacteroidota bacterium]
MFANRHPIDLSFLARSVEYDAEMLGIMIEMAGEQLAELRDVLHLAQLNSDTERLRFAAHKLKSTAGLLGRRDLLEPLDLLEDMHLRPMLPGEQAELVANVLGWADRALDALAVAEPIDYTDPAT